MLSRENLGKLVDLGVEAWNSKDAKSESFENFRMLFCAINLGLDPALDLNYLIRNQRNVSIAMLNRKIFSVQFLFNHLQNRDDVRCQLEENIVDYFKTVNPRFFNDNQSLKQLQRKLYYLNKYILTLENRSKERKRLTIDRDSLLQILNRQDIDVDFKLQEINRLEKRYKSPSLHNWGQNGLKLMGAVLIAAGVAVVCSVLGALAGAALTSWSGPGAAVGGFIGMLQGASIGWAHGVAIGASVVGIGAGIGSGLTMFKPSRSVKNRQVLELLHSAKGLVRQDEQQVKITSS